MKAAAVAILTAGLFVACRDQQSVTAVKPGLSADFSDGRSTGGNRHFFFLPPLVSQPSFSGAFNPLIQPVVDICQLDTSKSPAVCAAGVDHIILGPLLDATGQDYHVNWDTSQPQISTTQFYRIQVLGSPGSTCSAPPIVPCLGFADVDPVANGSQLKTVTGAYIGLVDGRTLPIKFRIEQGAFLSDFNCTDCVEATVTNNGATVVTNTGFAGAQFPAGWLQGTNPTPVVVTIERVTTIGGVTINDAGSVRCIPLAVLAVSAAPEQFEGCYRFTTLPLATFAKFVTVGICIPVTTLSETDLDAIQLYSVEEGEEGSTFGVKALPNVPAPFVSCAGFTSTPVSTGLLRGLPGQLLQQLARLVAPKSAYAFHLGAGGSTCCFSRIGWVLPASTLINFDVGPSGAIEAGSSVNTAYSHLGVINGVTVGVTFSRTLPGAFCGNSDVPNAIYANDNSPPPTVTSVSSANNFVTICPEGTLAGFGENSGGRIAASFTGTVTQTCIQVYVTGSETGATGFLEAFDDEGKSLGKTTSDPNAFGQNVCVNATATATIASVQFAGSGDGFAMFDNMTVRFSQAPPPMLPGLE